MKKFFLVYYSFFCLTAAFGQESPLQIVEKVFGKTQPINHLDYCTGLYKKDNCRPNRSDIREQFYLETVFEKDSDALVEMVLMDSLKRDFLNAYIFLKKENSWKIYSIKENPHFDKEHFEKKETIKNYSNAQLDSIVMTSNFRTKEKLINYLNHYMLINSTDKEIISFFKTNASRFDSLLTIVKTDHFKYTATNEDSIRKLGGKLSLDALNFDNDYKLFSIGRSAYGHGDVGFIYAEPNVMLPKCSPDNYLVIKKISGIWFFYRKEKETR